MVPVAEVAALDSGVYSETDQGDKPEKHRSDLDSHANMVCLGKGATIIRRTGLTINVSAFASDVGKLKGVPLVDAVIVYQDGTGNVYLLVVCNALYVPSMDHHLIPPFLMREAGLEVNELPKIQSPDPTEETHSIFHRGTGLRIPLQLHGIFSCFSSRAMSQEEMVNWRTYPIINATPGGPTWDPYNPVYAEEEAGFTDSEGNFIDDRLPTKRKFHLVEDYDDRMSELSGCESVWLSSISTQQYDDDIDTMFEHACSITTEGHDGSQADLDAEQRRLLSEREDGIYQSIVGSCSTLVEEVMAEVKHLLRNIFKLSSPSARRLVCQWRWYVIHIHPKLLTTCDSTCMKLALPCGVWRELRSGQTWLRDS